MEREGDSARHNRALRVLAPTLRRVTAVSSRHSLRTPSRSSNPPLPLKGNIMKASAVANALRTLVAAHQPAFIWGPPGVGKSSVIAQLARSLNLSLRDIRA